MLVASGAPRLGDAGVEADAVDPGLGRAVASEVLEALPQTDQHLLEEIRYLVGIVGEHVADRIDRSLMLSNQPSKFFFLHSIFVPSDEGGHSLDVPFGAKATSSPEKIFFAPPSPLCLYKDAHIFAHSLGRSLPPRRSYYPLDGDPIRIEGEAQIGVPSSSYLSLEPAPWGCSADLSSRAQSRPYRELERAGYPSSSYAPSLSREWGWSERETMDFRTFVAVI
ncbi:hypothetical protein HQ37_05645 [Porphyromonas sp. COT-239 OH1446]|nr:hypothetical protein HQ37_05645 [Porphyromonas sp. COT-239 OH1446]